MTVATKQILKKGEKLEWEEGSLVCIKKTNGKLGLAVKNSRCVVRNEHNKWIFKEEFDYISKPENYISIVRVGEKSRLINILAGEYITDLTLYVKERMNKESYLVMDLSRNVEIIFNLKRIKLGRYY